jgi:uncharacterized membrane protein YhaH (DUF805 family)
MNWYLEPFKKYIDFNGRARRKEYWYFLLFNTIISLVLALVFARGIDGESLINSIYSAIIFLPTLALGSRRLHDTNRSAWWLLVSFIPLFGMLLLFYFFAQESEITANEYGKNPKLP